MVHIWDCDAGQLHALETIGAESTAYGDAHLWEREKRTPIVAWHPNQPLLVVADRSGVVRWTPDGLRGGGISPTASYRSLAFSPDGQTLWAEPSSSAEPDAWQHSTDILDLDSGTVGTGPHWHTGIAAHPAGGLVATLHGDDIEGTIVVFARVDDETAPATMRMLRLALDLEVATYEAPIFGVDGRHLAIRGQRPREHPGSVRFPFTSARGEDDPRRLSLLAGLTRPEEGLVATRHRVRSPARCALARHSDRDPHLDEQHRVEHDVLDGHPVTALDTTPTGELVVAHAGGELVLLSVLADSANTHTPDDDTVRATVTAFLDATSEVPDDGDLETHLVTTDEISNWEWEDPPKWPEPRLRRT